MAFFCIIYGIGFLGFFLWVCHDDIRCFVGGHKVSLFLGLVTSCFWPFCLVVILGDYLADFLERIVSKKNTGS